MSVLGGPEHRRNPTARNCLTFVKRTAIAYEPKVGQNFTCLVVCNGGPFYERQEITTARLGVDGILNSSIPHHISYLDLEDV